MRVLCFMRNTPAAYAAISVLHRPVESAVESSVISPIVHPRLPATMTHAVSPPLVDPRHCCARGRLRVSRAAIRDTASRSPGACASGPLGVQGASWRLLSRRHAGEHLDDDLRAGLDCHG